VGDTAPEVIRPQFTLDVLGMPLESVLSYVAPAPAPAPAVAEAFPSPQQEVRARTKRASVAFGLSVLPPALLSLGARAQPRRPSEREAFRAVHN